MFRFKEFAIEQEHSPMKVGTDGVLLGAWVGIDPGVRRVLDIGTGTGVIALMLAQRTQRLPGVRITGIDIGDVAEARRNAEASPWGDRLRMVQGPVQRFDASDPFDLIVSNPPFYVGSLPSPDAGRTRVRHADELPFGELHDAVLRLLAPGGRFALVLPPPEAALFLAAAPGLAVVRRTEVRSTPKRGVRRLLLECVRRTGLPAGAEPECDLLTIGTGAHEEYTEEYRRLTRDFYLKF